MDAVNSPDRRNGATVPARDQKTGTCGYCKAVFAIDPKFPHKKFCNDTHRKLHWKYGSMSVGKVAERMLRGVRKMIDAEYKGWSARLEAIERRVSELECPAPEAVQRMDAERRAMRAAVLAALDGGPGSERTA